MELLRKGRAFLGGARRPRRRDDVASHAGELPALGYRHRELSGMGTPDFTGRPGVLFYTSKLFAFAGEDISRRRGVRGGHLRRRRQREALRARTIRLLIETEKLTSDFKVYVDPVDPVVKIEAGTEEVVLHQGQFSRWVPVEFPMIQTQAVTGMVRFYLRSVRPDLELYATPINFDPLSPAQAISTPADYAAELAKATGRFYTQGMPEDTKVIQEGVLTTDEFMAQAEIAGREIAEQYDYVLDQFEDGFLFYYTGNVDQISHVMWKTRDPEHPAYDPEVDPKYADLIENLYIELDDMVGKTLERMGDDTTLIIMSDHGFTSWRRTFHLNAWLREKGYLVVKNPDMEDDPGLFINVDWTQTQAYGAGINGLYINVRGRERNGIVAPERREAVMEAIAKDLLAEIDPETGMPAVTRVYKREEFYEDRGEIEIGPDISVGYAKGTRCSGHSGARRRRPRRADRQHRRLVGRPRDGPHHRPRDLALEPRAEEARAQTAGSRRRDSCGVRHRRAHQAAVHGGVNSRPCLDPPRK